MLACAFGGGAEDCLLDGFLVATGLGGASGHVAHGTAGDGTSVLVCSCSCCSCAVVGGGVLVWTCI